MVDDSKADTVEQVAAALIGCLHESCGSADGRVRGSRKRLDGPLLFNAGHVAAERSAGIADTRDVSRQENHGTGDQIRQARCRLAAIDRGRWRLELVCAEVAVSVDSVGRIRSPFAALIAGQLVWRRPARRARVWSRESARCGRDARCRDTVRLERDGLRRTAS